MGKEEVQLPEGMYEFVPANLQTLLNAIERSKKNCLERGIVIPVDLVTIEEQTPAVNGVIGNTDSNVVRQKSGQLRFERLRNVWQMGKNFGAKLWRFFATK
jgi:hypothetical protein